MTTIRQTVLGSAGICAAIIAVTLAVDSTTYRSQLVSLTQGTPVAWVDAHAEWELVSDPDTSIPINVISYEYSSDFITTGEAIEIADSSGIGPIADGDQYAINLSQ